jgi:copper(I)-binding protein
MDYTRYLSLIAFVALMPLAPVAAQNTSSAKAAADARSQPEPLAKVEGAWIRSSVPGQQGTGAFMKLTSRQAIQLVGVSTPVAGTAQVHEMKMEGDIMRMRQVAAVDLPAGQTVEFKAGGYHFMLMDLKQTLKPGTSVPLTLVFRDAQGTERKLDLKVAVATRAPGAVAAAPKGAQEAMQKH